VPRVCTPVGHVACGRQATGVGLAFELRGEYELEGFGTRTLLAYMDGVRPE